MTSTLSTSSTLEPDLNSVLESALNSIASKTEAENEAAIVGIANVHANGDTYAENANQQPVFDTQSSLDLTSSSNEISMGNHNDNDTNINHTHACNADNNAIHNNPSIDTDSWQSIHCHSNISSLNQSTDVNTNEITKEIENDVENDRTQNGKSTATKTKTTTTEKSIGIDNHIDRDGHVDNDQNPFETTNDNDNDHSKGKHENVSNISSSQEISLDDFINVDSANNDPSKLRSNSYPYSSEDEDDDEDIEYNLETAIAHKKKGNLSFISKSFQKALSEYTMAIKYCPKKKKKNKNSNNEMGNSMSNEQNEDNDEFDDNANDNDNSFYDEYLDDDTTTTIDAQGRKTEANEESNEETHNSNTNNIDQKTGDDDEHNNKEEEEEEETEEEKELNRIGKKYLSVFYCNRAATYIEIEEYESAIEDCNKTLEYNPLYLKGFWRRAKARESMGKFFDAQSDYKEMLGIDATHILARQHIKRLDPIVKQEFEKQKTEVVDKLKTFANWGLGKLGLSLENFVTEQNPETGAYNIQFKNG